MIILSTEQLAKTYDSVHGRFATVIELADDGVVLQFADKSTEKVSVSDPAMVADVAIVYFDEEGKLKLVGYTTELDKTTTASAKVPKAKGKGCAGREMMYNPNV